MGLKHIDLRWSRVEIKIWDNFCRIFHRIFNRLPQAVLSN